MKELLLQNWPLLLFAVTGVVLVVIALASLRDGPLPYERRGVLLSPAEVSFLRSLHLAVREDWLVFSMVRLADIIQVRPKTRKTSFWQGQIKNKHLDFVLCDYETLEVKLAIEFEDDTTSRTEKAKRDKFLNTALHAAGLPLMRIKAEAKYETAAIRKDIEDALGIQRKKKR
jgi:very-short-patch-repair endonuclease